MQSIHFVTELYLHPLINIFKGLDFILTCILYFERFFFLYRHGCEGSWVLKGQGASSFTTLSPFPLRQVLLTFFSAVEASKPTHPSVSPPLFSELKAVCWIYLDCYIGAGIRPPVVMIVQQIPWTTEPSLQPYLFICYSSTISCITF